MEGAPPDLKAALSARKETDKKEFGREKEVAQRHRGRYDQSHTISELEVVHRFLYMRTSKQGGKVSAMHDRSRLLYRSKERK